MSPYKDPDKQREFQRNRAANNRADYMAGKKCVSCGSQAQLELDHIDPATKIHHAIWSWSRERRLAELAKCQVLCKSCHQEKTNEQNYPPRQHGTPAMYNRGRCRCDPCKGAHAKVAAQYRARKRAA